jgi:hypothetical protein
LPVQSFTRKEVKETRYNGGEGGNKRIEKAGLLLWQAGLAGASSLSLFSYPFSPFAFNLLLVCLFVACLMQKIHVLW